MFSAGGNDLQLGLKEGRYVHRYDPSRSVDMYLTEQGEAAMARIGDGYRHLSKELFEQFPALRIIFHGYDYPRPRLGKGEFIGQFLRKLGIPENLMEPIMIAILNKLNDTIKQATCAVPTVTFLDCLDKTKLYTWYDDMHPGNDGFKALALLFEETMSR